jgi:hypothetical protein
VPLMPRLENEVARTCFSDMIAQHDATRPSST